MTQATIGSFYVDFRKALGEDFSEYEFTPQYVPLVRFHRSPEWQHNPVTVCQWALFNYNAYISSEKNKYYEIFLNQAEWLAATATEGPNDSAVWLYHVDIPFYGIEKPWISGMAQGEALAVLVRAHALSGDERFTRIAQKASRIFQVAVSDGGVMATFPDGKPIIEEYPAVHLTGVLNGFMLALLGMSDYAAYTDDPEIRRLFINCIQGLVTNLFRYDCGYWSLYDLWQPVRLSSVAYHRLHIVLLQVLGKLTDEPFLISSARTWQGYLKNPVSRGRWMLEKLKYRIRHE